MVEYKERIKALIEELEKEKVKLTSLVEHCEAIKVQRLEHLQRAKFIGQFLASQHKETVGLASRLIRN